MTRRPALAAATAIVAALAARPARAGAPVEAAIIVAPPAELRPITARLAGHSIRIGDGVVVIDDIAGAGRPWVGVVERRGPALWLVTAVGAFELVGPLARPRIAGPGYLVWVIGRREGTRLRATRLGVLERPRR